MSHSKEFQLICGHPRDPGTCVLGYRSHPYPFIPFPIGWRKGKVNGECVTQGGGRSLIWENGRRPYPGLLCLTPLEGVSKFKMLEVENRPILQIFWFWRMMLPKRPVPSEPGPIRATRQPALALSSKLRLLTKPRCRLTDQPPKPP